MQKHSDVKTETKHGKSQLQPKEDINHTNAYSLKRHTLNYSFMKIEKLNDILKELNEESAKDKITSKTKLSAKVTTVKLASNNIQDATDLHSCLSQLICSLDNIKFIDLSVNNICSIGTSLNMFRHISVLYLHANNIHSFSGIKPLEVLHKLTNLTLHGNPIEQHKHYRNYVLNLLPALLKLDFALITKQDRENSITWSAMFRNKISINKK